MVLIASDTRQPWVNQLSTRSYISRELALSAVVLVFSMRSECAIISEQVEPAVKPVGTVTCDTAQVGKRHQRTPSAGAVLRKSTTFRLPPQESRTTRCIASFQRCQSWPHGLICVLPKCSKGCAIIVCILAYLNPHASAQESHRVCGRTTPAPAQAVRVQSRSAFVCVESGGHHSAASPHIKASSQKARKVRTPALSMLAFLNTQRPRKARLMIHSMWSRSSGRQGGRSGHPLAVLSAVPLSLGALFCAAADRKLCTSGAS